MITQTHSEYIKEYLGESMQILYMMPIEDIDRVIEILYDGWKNDATIFVMGNGGSASTASHFAADLIKYTSADNNNGKNTKKRFKVMCLNDNVAINSAITNDIGFSSTFSEQLIPWIKKDDIVFAFSVHGGSGETKYGKWSQNIPQAFSLAKKSGAKLIGMAGDTGGIMKDSADACIVIPKVKAETITPQVEGFHVVIHHLIVHRLRDLIKASKQT